MNEIEPKLVRSKRAARESALRALYSILIGKVDIADGLGEETLGNAFSHETAEFVDRLVTNTAESREDLDTKFSPHLAKGWELDRLAAIDRILLEMACYELWNESEVPPKVVIDEYVRLAKTYGSADSGKFVNGVLASVLAVSPKNDWTPTAYTRPEPAPEPEMTPQPPEETLPPSGPKWVIKSDR